MTHIWTHVVTCGALQVVDRVVEAVGPDRTGIRISPFGAFLEPVSPDALPLFKHFVSELSKRRLLYLHSIEARVGTVATMFGAPSRTTGAQCFYCKCAC